MKWNQIEQSKQNMLKRISNYKSDFNPNSKSEYSNSNFILLTYILEDVYKKSFSNILQEKIIEPLSLENTFYGEKINPGDNEAFSYSYLGKWNKESETNMSVPQGAGAIVSMPEELTISSNSRFNEKLFPKRVWKK